MTTQAPEKSGFSSEATMVVALVMLAFARWLNRAARKVGGPEVASRVEQQAEIRREYSIYTVATLEENLHRFEEHFELETSTFLLLYRENAVPATISRHAANTWAGVADELERLREQAGDGDELFTAAVA